MFRDQAAINCVRVKSRDDYILWIIQIRFITNKYSVRYFICNYFLSLYPAPYVSYVFHIFSILTLIILFLLQLSWFSILFYISHFRTVAWVLDLNFALLRIIFFILLCVKLIICKLQRILKQQLNYNLQDIDKKATCQYTQWLAAHFIPFQSRLTQLEYRKIMLILCVFMVFVSVESAYRSWNSLQFVYQPTRRLVVCKYTLAIHKSLIIHLCIN